MAGEPARRRRMIGLNLSLGLPRSPPRPRNLDLAGSDLALRYSPLPPPAISASEEIGGGDAAASTADAMDLHRQPYSPDYSPDSPYNPLSPPLPGVSDDDSGRPYELILDRINGDTEAALIEEEPPAIEDEPAVDMAAMDLHNPYSPDYSLGTPTRPDYSPYSPYQPFGHEHPPYNPLVMLPPLPRVSDDDSSPPYSPDYSPSAPLPTRPDYSPYNPLSPPLPGASDDDSGPPYSPDYNPDTSLPTSPDYSPFFPDDQVFGHEHPPYNPLSPPLPGVSDDDLEDDATAASCAACFDCNICFELADEPVVTSCGHLFCWPCLYQWLHVHSERNECPVCKGEVAETNITPIYSRGGGIRTTGLGKKNGAEAEISSLMIPPRPHANRVQSTWQQIMPWTSSDSPEDPGPASARNAALPDQASRSTSRSVAMIQGEGLMPDNGNGEPSNRGPDSLDADDEGLNGHMRRRRRRLN